MGRRPQPTPPTTFNAFRTAERYWKSRTVPPDLSRALDLDSVSWVSDGDEERATWAAHDERLFHLKRLRLDPEALEDPSWKGKGAAMDTEDHATAVLVEELPGLVLFSQVMPARLQRRLAVESLRSCRHPHASSLDPHYEWPQAAGLWQTVERGRGADSVRLKGCEQTKLSEGARKMVDFEPVNESNWLETGPSRAPPLPATLSGEVRQPGPDPSSVSVEELVRRLRWVTIGLQYDWSSKTYRFERGQLPLPPLIRQCCHQLVRAVPWQRLFANVDDDTESQSWHHDYEPEGGVVNFYQLRDSLTAHIDQSEVDAVRPLVSLSIGSAAIFLYGGVTRDDVPLPIIVRSGDALIMSGHAGRRVFHGLPRILQDSVPDYLRHDVSLTPDQLDVAPSEWTRCGEYLEQGARLNINVRQVFSTPEQRAQAVAASTSTTA